MKTKAEYLPKQYLNDPAGGKYAKCFLIRGLEETPEGKRNKWHVIGYVGKRDTKGDTMPWIAHRPEDKAGVTAAGQLKRAQKVLAELWEAQQPKDGIVTVPGRRLVCSNTLGEGGHEALTAPQRQQAESRSHRLGCNEPVVSVDYTPFDVSKQNDTADAREYINQRLPDWELAHPESVVKVITHEVAEAFLKARQTAR